MEKTNKSLIGGLSGAAILALLFATPSSKPAAPSAISRVSSPISQAKAKLRAAAALDDSGPWAALCQEYWTSPDKVAEPVEWKSDPPNAVGATDYTLHSKDKDNDQKFSVFTYPVNPNLGACRSDNERVRTIIATAPDPLSSHLQLDFDRSIVAFQRAAGLMNYDFQRYWFPWTTAGGADDSRQGSDEDQMRLRLQQPGAIVFRKSPDRRAKDEADERLVIFVVGETPTGGLNRRQFNQALVYAEQLRSPDAKPEIGIAGPQFSASLRGMADILIARQAPTGAPSETLYRVYSPSASSDFLINDFSCRLQQKNIRHDLVTFEATYMSSLKLLLRTLKSYGYDDRQLAVLVEDESAFGGNVARTDQTKVEDKKDDSNNCQDSDSGEQNEKRATKAADEELPGILTLQFPRDLSAIRNAADSQAGAQPDSSTTPALGVPLSLRERTLGESDSPPSYAREQSAAALDRELQGIVRSLRANQSQVVILAVSNPLDRVYLFDYLHRALPDVRLATLDSDVFMLGRPRFVDLRGTIGVTALPLMNTSEVRVKPGPDSPQRTAKVEFSSTPQAGTYMSTLSLLTDPATRPVIDAQPYTPNNCALVTFVGKNGFLPGSLRNRRDREQGCRPQLRAGIAQLRLGAPLIPWSWTVLTAFLLTGATIHIGCCLRNSFTENPQATDSESGRGSLRPLLVVRSSSPHRIEKLFMLLAISNQLLLLEWMVVTASMGAAFVIAANNNVSLFPLDVYAFYKTFKLVQSLNLLLHPFVLAGCLVLSGRIVARLLNEYVHRHEDDEAAKEWTRYFRVNFPVTILYFVATALAWWRVLGGESWVPDPAVALRSINLLDGLSPLAMMAAIFLAYALWGYSQLQRITMMETRQVRLEFRDRKEKKEADPRLQPFERLHEKLHDEVDYSRQMKLQMVPLAVAVGACVLLRLNVALRGIDGTGLRYWSMFFGLGMLVLLLSVSYKQMWALWDRLRAILNFLNATPLRDTFAKLPKDISSMRIWRVGVARYSLAIQQQTLDELESIVCSPLALAKAAAAGTKGEGQTADSTASATAQARSADVEKLHEQLNAARSVVRRVEAGDCSVQDADVQLVRTTLNLRLAETIPLLDQGDPNQAAPTALATYLAYRFLALIQYSLLQIRNMVLFQVFAYACLVICVTMYPFQGRQSLSMLMTLLFFGLLGVLGLLFAQIDRDPILGRLEKKEEEGKELGSVSYVNVLGKILAVGGVPMMAVLTSQFPSFADFFSNWLRPVSEALK